MVNQSEKGLTYHNIALKDNLIIDADNSFWAIPGEDGEGNPTIPRKALSLYENIRGDLDNQMNDFRFGANLTALYIDPTDRCNANCPYCYIPARIRKKGRSMTENELFFILEKAAKYFREQKRKAVIVFHAAEPLLVKDIIFKGIKKFNNDFKFGLQTNASLLEIDDVGFLREFQVGVGISLDYYSPKINNRLRPLDGGSGNFRAAIRAIEWFNGYEGMNVITTITKFNVTGLSGMIKFMHAKKVPCVLLNPVRLTQKNSRFLKPNEALMSRYFIKAVDKAIELSKKSGHRIIIGNFTNVILGIVAPTARRLMCDISPCGGGRCFLTITASGRMIPCGEFIGLKEFSGGNIFKSGIKEAMQSPSFKKVRERFVEKIEECKSCTLRNICGAPCPAELHSLGNMYKKAVFCEFYKKVVNHAFKLITTGEEKYCFRKQGLNNLEYEYKLLR
ncbi:MAG: peptide-modifying radical SAM enzyme CbpB [Candidatus Omnitrophota bacterium]